MFRYCPGANSNMCPGGKFVHSLDLYSNSAESQAPRLKTKKNTGQLFYAVASYNPLGSGPWIAVNSIFVRLDLLCPFILSVFV